MNSVNRDRGMVRSEVAHYSVWHEFASLVKFRLATVVVFSSLMGYVIAGYGSSLAWRTFLLLAIGGCLVTFAANALNEVLEREYDKMMSRTEDRPLAAGRMSPSSGVLIAGIMALLGVTVLTYLEPMAGFVSMISLVIYVLIYTPLKRYSPAAVYVGAVPGALPVMIGVLVVSGEINSLALVLFGIQFFWQLPHFWAIAWLAHEDYEKAGFRLLPNRDNRKDGSVGKQSAFHALLIIVIIVTGFILDELSAIGLIFAIGLTIWYAYKGWQMAGSNDRKSARSLMFASFAYLPIILSILFIDALLT